jgi:hypothetical protein
VENAAISLRTRVSLGIATTISVASAELGTCFCFNIHLAIAGLLTVFVILPLSWIATARMGARGGFLIAIASLGCIPATAIIATWELRRSLGHPQGSSDLEDLLVFLLLLAGFAMATTFAIRRSGTELTAPVGQATRRAFFAAIIIAVILISVAIAMRRSIQVSPYNEGGAAVPVLAVAGAGLALAIGFGIAARRTSAKHEGLASGVSALHTGQGWLAFDDGTPPIHRPEFAARSEGPVMVRGWAGVASHGYRDPPAPDARLTVAFGTPESIRNAGTARAASYEVIGLAVLAFSVLALVPLPLVALFTDDMSPAGLAFCCQTETGCYCQQESCGAGAMPVPICRSSKK